MPTTAHTIVRSSPKKKIVAATGGVQLNISSNSSEKTAGTPASTSGDVTAAIAKFLPLAKSRFDISPRGAISFGILRVLYKLSGLNSNFQHPMP
jgi:hypothetical protein